MPGETFADALSKVDTEVLDRRDDGTSVISVLGLKEVEAAHRAEVERAVAAEREACAKVCDDRLCVKCRRGMACGNDDCHEGMECAAAIRARGGA